MSKALSSDISGNPVFIMLMFVLVIIIFLAIFRSVSPFLTMGLGLNAHIGSLRGSFQIEAFDNQETSGPTFVFFYMDGCSHCENAKPEFARFQKSYKGPVNIIKIDGNDPSNKELVENNNIRGYPTFKYFPNGLNGESKEYNGTERTADDFNKFIST